MAARITRTLSDFEIMSKTFQIIASLTVLLICGIAAVNYWLASVLLDNNSFNSSRSFAIQTVGAFTDPDAKETYESLTLSSGLNFPDGTLIEMHVDGWDTVNCCCEIPGSEYTNFVKGFLQSPVTPRVQAMMDWKLSPANLRLPDTACRLEFELGVIEHSFVDIFSDDPTNRIWVRLQYPLIYD